MATLLSDDQELVLSIIKEWYEELDAAYLAIENQVVYWGPLNGNVRQQGWNKLKLSDALKIVRATRVPVGVMKLCTEELMIAAAQEEDRAYQQGVSTSANLVSKEFFNFAHHSGQEYRPAAEVLEHRIAIHLIAECQARDLNVRWLDLAEMFDMCSAELGRQRQTRVQRNKFLRYGLNDTAYELRQLTGGKNARYVWTDEHGKTWQLNCIKLPHISGCKIEWTPQEMRAIVKAAVKTLMK